MSLGISILPCSYMGETFYDARVGVPGVVVQQGYGRSPERALAFALRKLADSFLSGRHPLIVDPLPPGMTSEAVEFVGEYAVADGEEAKP